MTFPWSHMGDPEQDFTNAGGCVENYDDYLIYVRNNVETPDPREDEWIEEMIEQDRLEARAEADHAQDAHEMGLVF